uniref:Uncharacterized protein n=1 Tax=Trichobilharzia regenti TaxID=157069 RepID=A0AA85JA92_TRIRE
VDEGLSNILRHLTSYAAYSLYKSIKRLREMKVTGCTEAFMVFEGDRNSVVDKRLQLHMFSKQQCAIAMPSSSSYQIQYIYQS